MWVFSESASHFAVMQGAKLRTQRQGSWRGMSDFIIDLACQQAHKHEFFRQHSHCLRRYFETLSSRTHRMTALINESAKRSSSQTFFVRNERNFFCVCRLLARHCGDPWWMWTPSLLRFPLPGVLEFLVNSFLENQSYVPVYSDTPGTRLGLCVRTQKSSMR